MTPSWLTIEVVVRLDASRGSKLIDAFEQALTATCGEQPSKVGTETAAQAVAFLAKKYGAEQ